MSYQPRLKQLYQDKVKASLKEKMNYTTIMQVPKIEKIVINRGCGEAIKDSKYLDKAVEEIKLITGRKPKVVAAKKSVSNFKLRQGLHKIGVCVNLRDSVMYEFLDRLISVYTPRIRDFDGFPRNSFDGRGNYNFGIKEQTVFPEIKFDNILKVDGFNVTIVTSAKTDEEALELLKAMGFPFKKINKDWCNG